MSNGVVSMWGDGAVSIGRLSGDAHGRRGYRHRNAGRRMRARCTMDAGHRIDRALGWVGALPVRCRASAGYDGDGLSAVIAARKWSVTLVGSEEWVEVEWPSEAMATWLEGKPVRTQIDFPFQSPRLTVCGSDLIGTCRRFHYREGADLG